MNKNELVRKFEAEMDWSLEQAKEDNKVGVFKNAYIKWLKAKATAYDRLMGGGKKTLKELANILGKPVAIDAGNRLWWFPKKPEIGWATWIWYDNQFGSFGEELPNGLINYTGNWEDSLTLPDGWEE